MEPMRQARRSIPLLVGAVLLAGCTSAGGSVLPSTIGSTVTSSTAPTVPIVGTAPSAPSETDVWVPAGDHRVPGTLALPALTPGERVPAVLLLHGDLSSRDENADIFGRLAAALSARGIASLRIDFAGSGDSEEPDLALDYSSMVTDATASLTYLGADAVLDPNRLAVLGLSRGGSIAATVAGTVPGVAAMVSWSGAIYNGYDEDPDGHQEAAENGYTPVDLGDRVFKLSLAWYDSIENAHPLDDVAGYTGPVLAVVGSDDQVVPPEVSDDFLATVASTDKTLHTIDGADHGFSADPAYGDEAIDVTTDWLVTRLGAR
jgi:fermentation-respiration switch protein FrsA (DUF1100 family)